MKRIRNGDIGAYVHWYGVKNDYIFGKGARTAVFIGYCQRNRVSSRIEKAIINNTLFREIGSVYNPLAAEYTWCAVSKCNRLMNITDGKSGVHVHIGL